MADTESKISRHAKKQENVICQQRKPQFPEADPQTSQMLKRADRDLKQLERVFISSHFVPDLVLCPEDRNVSEPLLLPHAFRKVPFVGREGSWWKEF